MSPTVVILGFLLLFDVAAYWIVRPLWQPTSGRIRVAMAGRSTMQLWFKHWNWPYPLRIKTTYKPWPIAYRRYSTDKVHMVYLPLEGPKAGQPGSVFGERMIAGFERGLSGDHYDAAFFKFCFVDFSVSDEDREERFGNLTGTIEKAREVAAKRGLKLIVGNALPLPEPSEATLRLQRDFNEWLRRFATSRDDVLVFDVFSLLADEKGRLHKGLAKSPDDPHPGEKAFAVLDKAFARDVIPWLEVVIHKPRSREVV